MSQIGAEAINESVVRRWKRYPAYKDSGVEWLGEIPEHWKVKPLKYVVKINSDVLAENTPSNYTLRYVDISNVDSNGSILEVQEMRFEDSPSRARRRVQQGDTIISTVRTYLRAITFISNPSENLIVSTGFAVLSPKGFLHPGFLFRLVQSQEFIEKVVAYSEGVGYPAINPSRLTSLQTWLPPLLEQQAIASFLDRETAKIDTLIAKKEQLIQLLQEKRTALISHVVTKGLNPDVPMKDSGVEWLGEIPDHWEVKRIRNITKSLQTGPFGSQLHSDEYSSGGIPVINPSHLKDGQIEPDWDCAVDRETWQKLSRHELCEGDIIFGRRGEMGRCALVTQNEAGWLCGTGSLRMRPKNDVSHPRFINWVLVTSGIRDWLLLESVGTTMDNLNTKILASVPLPVPPVNEQEAIASFLDRETTKLDALIAKIRTGIEQVKEYRTALISSAVTGKIDIRNY